MACVGGTHHGVCVEGGELGGGDNRAEAGPEYQEIVVYAIGRPSHWTAVQQLAAGESDTVKT